VIKIILTLHQLSEKLLNVSLSALFLYEYTVLKSGALFFSIFELKGNIKVFNIGHVVLKVQLYILYKHNISAEQK
jgi:hypothetical protein